MRHRNTGRSFSRTSSHRKAMFSNMCCSLIEHELIKTTLAKAKELRSYIEPIITVGKTDSVASRRHVFNKLRSKDAVGKLFTTLGPRYEDRPGGYVRVLKCGFRAGDNAPMAIVELMDRGHETSIEAPVKEKKTGAKKESKVKASASKDDKPAKAKASDKTKVKAKVKAEPKAKKED